MTATSLLSRNIVAQVVAIARRPAALTSPVVPDSWGQLALHGSHAARRLFARLVAFRLGCLLGGHTDYFAREPHRLFLRCGECGRCTPGWVTGWHPPRVTYAVERRDEPPFGFRNVRTAGQRAALSPTAQAITSHA